MVSPDAPFAAKLVAYVLHITFGERAPDVLLATMFGFAMVCAVTMMWMVLDGFCNLLARASGPRMLARKNRRSRT